MKTFEEVVLREKAYFIPRSHIAEKTVAQRIDECVTEPMRQMELRNRNLEKLRDDLLQVRLEVGRKNCQTQWGGRPISASGEIVPPTITGDEGDLVYAQTAFVSDLVSWVHEKIGIVHSTIRAFQNDAIAKHPVDPDNPDISLLQHAQKISDEIAQSVQDLLDEECEF